jgi:hypothetical protein
VFLNHYPPFKVPRIQKIYSSNMRIQDKFSRKCLAEKEVSQKSYKLQKHLIKLHHYLEIKLLTFSKEEKESKNILKQTSERVEYKQSGYFQESNMLHDSIIVFTSDNGGPANGFNLNYASNWPLRGVIK